MIHLNWNEVLLCEWDHFYSLYECLSSFHQDLDKYLKQQIPHIYQEGILNNQTIGIDDVKVIKKMAKEIAEKETELSQRKEHINKKIKEVKNIGVSTQNVYDVQDQ